MPNRRKVLAERSTFTETVRKQTGRHRLGQLDSVHLALSFGVTKPSDIAALTGIGRRCVSDSLYWLNRANDDLELARKLRSAYSSEQKEWRRVIDYLQ